MLSQEQQLATMLIDRAPSMMPWTQADISHILPYCQFMCCEDRWKREHIHKLRAYFVRYFRTNVPLS